MQTDYRTSEFWDLTGAKHCLNKTTKVTKLLVGVGSGIFKKRYLKLGLEIAALQYSLVLHCVCPPEVGSNLWNCPLYYNSLLICVTSMECPSFLFWKGLILFWPS